MPVWYPLMLDIRDRLCVVFGGGAVAERKTAGLLEAGARVRLVSPELTPALSRLEEERRLEWLPREADESDLNGAALVFAATSSPDTNRRIVSAAKECGVPVNSADDGGAGNFLVPAVLRRGKFVLTASVSGAGPGLASRVIRDLALKYGPEYAGYADALSRIRAVVKQHVPDPDERRKLLVAAAGALVEWQQSEEGLGADPQRLLERLRTIAAEQDVPNEDIS